MLRLARALPFVAILALVVVSNGGAPVGGAEPEPTAAAGSAEEGQRLFEQGLLRYDTAEYDQAITLFREAYQRTHAPALLFNMAQAHRLKGDCRKAADLYRQFIRLEPASPDRPRAESRVAELEPCSTTPSQSPAGAVPVTVPPLPRSASSPAAAAMRSTAGVTGISTSQATWRTAGVVLGGVALGLGAAAAVYARRADDSSDRISELFARGGPWTAEAAAADAEGRSARQTALVLLTATATSALLGAALYLYGRLTD